MKKIPSVLVLIACLLPFIRLGIGEIQPWDEALYAVRANACLKFGVWLDQTRYAVGGLYSAWHPPFGVWLIALSKLLFGNSTFATRLPLACAASGAILIIWFAARRLGSETGALITAISLATSDLFLEYSHRAQMECMIVFLSAASIYLLIKSVDKENWSLALFSGVCLGISLCTKLGYGLYIVPMLLLLPWAMSRQHTYRFVLIAISVGLLITIPWFVMMAVRHPGFFSFVYDYLHTFRAGEYAPSSLAWWYYLNRLFVAIPLIVLMIFLRKPDRILLAFGFWLASVLIILQIVGTKMPHFATLLLLPGALLIGATWDKINTSNNIKYSILVLLSIAIVWSSSEQLRMFLTRRLPWSEYIISVPATIVLGLAIAIALIVWMQNNSLSRLAYSISIVLLGIALGHLLAEEESVFIDGASQIGEMVKKLPSKGTIDVIHYDYPHEQYAPQLAYYTDGWTLGWIPEKFSRTITWDSAVTAAYHPDSSSEIAVVPRFQDRFYHRPEKETVFWQSLMYKLRQSFSHEQEFRSYSIFY